MAEPSAGGSGVFLDVSEDGGDDDEKMISDLGVDARGQLEALRL